jgi:guanylate kinase
MNTEEPNCPSYPIILILSGPSGVGKDTIARELLRRRPDSFHFVVTATTRDPRPGEVHGYDYMFVSNDEFAGMIERDDLLEYAVVYNDYKGIPKIHIQDALESGRDVIIRVDVQGAATLRKIVPQAISVFLRTRTEEALVKRLTLRKSDSAEGLALRIATARGEMRRMDEFDYCVINPQGEPDRAVEHILAIVDAAHCRTHQSPIII